MAGLPKLHPLRRRSRALAALLAFVFGLVVYTPVSGAVQPPPTWQGEIDGYPVWITVVPHGHEIDPDVQQSGEWWQWGNATTDAYIFAFEQSDNVRLILAFDSGEDGSPEARVYVNDFGRERVEYALDGGQLHILSNDGHPSLIIRPKDGDWYVQDKVNYNLILLQDGMAEEVYGNAFPDGVIDRTTEVGSEEPGVPAWQVVRLVNDFAPTWGYQRFAAIKRLPSAPPFKVKSPVMPSFPYLGIYGAAFDHFLENPQPLGFYMHRSTFELFSFVGMQSGHYAVNSHSLPPDIDFESPYAWYNFDPVSRYPQLLVRGFYSPKDDLFVRDAVGVRDRSSYRYSWKTGDEQKWRYTLHGEGLFSYDEVVSIGDVEFNAISPENLPGWVASNPWPVVSFVEAEDSYFGGEGIYFGSTQINEITSWVDGLGDTTPDLLPYPVLQETLDLGVYGNLPPGFRRDYYYGDGRRIELYLSPLDNRLHLLDAQGGVWNLDYDHVLRVHNLDGDNYLDGWTLEILTSEPDEDGLRQATPGKVIEALYDVDGFLLHSESGRVTIVQSDHEQAAFIIAPPTDKESWEFFRTQLRPYETQRRDPANLRAWLDPFPGPRSEVKGASLANLRIIDDGFRFELSLEPGFVVAGPDLIGLAAAEPGDYLVENRGGVFSLKPLAPAQLTIDLRQLAAGAPVQVTVGNSGMADVNGLFLVVETPGSDDTPNELLNQPIDALAGETTEALVTIPSNTPAGSTLAVRLEDATGMVVAEAAPLPLPGAPSAGRVGVFDIGRAPVLWPVVGAFATLLAAAGLMAVRRREETL